MVMIDQQSIRPNLQYKPLIMNYAFYILLVGVTFPLFYDYMTKVYPLFAAVTTTVRSLEIIKLDTIVNNIVDVDKDLSQARI